MANNYVDNKQFSKSLGIWAKKVREQLEQGEKPDKMTDYITECILKICNGMAYKPSFYNYSYVDEMVADSVENILRYAKNFDLSVSTNGFSFISTIVYYAFVRRIKKENKRHIDHLCYIRDTFSEDDIREVLDGDNPNDIKHYTTYIDYMSGILDDMGVELPEKSKKKKIRKKTSIDDILKGEKY